MTIINLHLTLSHIPKQTSQTLFLYAQTHMIPATALMRANGFTNMTERTMSTISIPRWRTYSCSVAQGCLSPLCAVWSGAHIQYGGGPSLIRVLNSPTTHIQYGGGFILLLLFILVAWRWLLPSALIGLSLLPSINTGERNIVDLHNVVYALRSLFL